MGLQAVYERFLASPNAAALASSANLQYVTTLQNIAQQSKIISHLESQQQNIVRKKNEKVISAVEGLTSVAVIVETTLEFISAGGGYLPGLDSFIVDRSATLPVTHFVHFDQDGKILQIRLSWDQGDLLKQVEVIGARGRNWPVYGGKEQIKMISASTNTANEVNPAPALTPPRGRNAGVGDRSSSPTKKYIRDPHTSLDLSAQYSDDRGSTAPNAVAPRESHKPAPREMNELFAAGHEDLQSGPDGSPKKVYKDNVVAPKGAGHKKFQPSRLFDDDSPPPKEAKIYKTNPARYNHFDIGDAIENDHFQHRSENVKPTEVPIRPVGRHHKAQWDFQDDMTPEKKNHKQMQGRIDSEAHFDYSQGRQDQPKAQHKQMQGRIDSEAHFELQDAGTPFHRPIVPKARKDANAHFEFGDETTPGPNKRIIARTAAAKNLYNDLVLGLEDDEQPLAAISNNTRKNKALETHWDLNDDAPANGKATKAGQGRKDLGAHWGPGNEETAPKQSTRSGGRRDADKGFWDF